MPSESNPPTKSGIITDTNGIRHIPSSVRADGSVRKEIKIRPGYRPPEDVEVYKNRTAEAFRNRGKGQIPGSEVVDAQPEDKDRDVSAASSKNAKRREARKKAAAVTAATAAASEKDKAEDTVAVTEKAEVEEIKDVGAGKDKEVKKLLKKLRQARELKDKKDSGTALLPEQLEKVIRINELIRQLDNMGFTSEGDKKEIP